MGRVVFAILFATRDGYGIERVWQLRGAFVGALGGVAIELLIRRNQPLQPRFTVIEMLAAMTILALVVGMSCIRY
jgi:hypothetical protein